MGQGARSGLAQILAEERMVDWNQVTVVQSLADPIVSYLTGGSSAVRGRFATLRNAFAVDSAIDGLALGAGIDPFVFRASHLVDARVAAVLHAADGASGWRTTLPAGHAWGVSLAESFGTVVCEVVEISQPAAGDLRVHRVTCVVDCGTVINPDSVEAQMQGAIVHGLNATL